MEALRKVDADLLELGEHRSGLDPLGHRRDAERAPDLADGLHHAAVDRVLRHICDELTVDLQEIDRQRLQVPERREAAAEVVEREAAAARAQFLHEIGRVLQVRHRRRFGDLEAEAACDFVAVDAAEHELEETLIVERRTRQVDRKERRGVAMLPQEFNRALHDPAVDHAHHVVALGGGNELVRRHDGPGVVAQPHGELRERLRDARRADRADCLEAQLEPAFIDGARYLRHPMHFAMARRGAAAIVEMDAVASMVLRRIAGDVGRGEHTRGTFRLRTDLDHTDARADRQARRAPHEPVVAHSLAHVLGNQARLFERAVLEQHAELVATQARDGVRRAYARLQKAGDVTDQAVAGGMPAGVVDELELVEVDIEQRVACAVAPCGLHGLMQPVVEFATVDEPGERIVTRLVGERALQAAFLGDVVKHDHRTDDLADAIANRRGRILDRQRLAVAAREHALFARAHLFAGTQSDEQRILERRPRRLVNDAEHIADGTPACFVDRPARENARNRVQVVDAAGCIRRYHGIADRLQRNLGTFLFGEDRLLGLLALGDVGDRALIADDVAGVVAHRVRALEHHDLLAVASAQAELRIADLALAVEAPHEIGAVGGKPVAHRRARQCIKLLGRRVAEHPHEGRIHRQQAPITRALVHAFHRVLEELPELRFARAQGRVGRAALDRNAGQLGRVLEQLQLVAGGQSDLPPIDAERAEHLAGTRLDRRRRRRAYAAFECSVAT